MFPLFVTFTLFNFLTVSAQPGNDDKMKWWDEARFGMFIHWGVYSELGGVWEGEPVSGYAEHILRAKEIPLQRYREEVAAHFNPLEFDAEEWVKLCKSAGMKYMVITSKHHDGFAMFDTRVEGWEDYDIVDGTEFKRDPMVELKEACDKHGIKFGFYYSHAQDWSHRFGQRNSWDFDHPTQKRPPWHDQPEWAGHREKSLIYVEEKSIPQLEEILSEKYDPDMIWFDTPSWLPQEYNQMILKRAREIAGLNVIFNSRSAGGYADYKSTTDKPEVFPPVEGYWEAIPTTNESYGYHKMDTSHKPASHFIKLLSKAAARGGNLLMNVGPKGDGSIADVDIEILTGIGEWMQVNGEAIYGTKRTPLPVHAWGESTLKGNNLYLHVHQCPESKEIIVAGLKTRVKKIYLLADPSKKALTYNRNSDGDITVDLTGITKNEVVSVVAVECEGDIQCDGTRVIAPDMTNSFHAFDGKISGEIKYGKGNHRENHIYNWVNTDDSITWVNRTIKPGKFSVYAIYDADRSSGENTYEVRIGNESIIANVEPNTQYKRIELGTVELEKGEAIITVKAVNLINNDLMKFRAVILEPVNLN